MAGMGGIALDFATYDTVVGGYSAAGAWTLGAAASQNYSAPPHLISGHFVVKTPTGPTLDASGQLFISTNLNYNDQARTVRYESTLGGCGILLDSRASLSNPAFEIYMNKPSDLLATTATNVFNITHAGAVTLGADGFDGSHTLNQDTINLVGSGTNKTVLVRSTSDRSRMLIAGGSGVSQTEGAYIAIYGATFNAGSYGHIEYVAGTNNFSVSNRAHIFYGYTSGLRELCYFKQDGTVYNYSNSTSWNTTSDIRIKTNIREISEGLNKICSLHPVHFEYKHRIGKNKTGFIAQEFEQVLPGHVSEQMVDEEILNANPELSKGDLIKSLDVDLHPYLVKAIQELNAKIEAQQIEINLLKAS